MVDGGGVVALAWPTTIYHPLSTPSLFASPFAPWRFRDRRTSYLKSSEKNFFISSHDWRSARSLYLMFGILWRSASGLVKACCASGYSMTLNPAPALLISSLNF